MQIISVEDGLVQVDVDPEEAFDADYDMVRNFVLAETGYAIAGPGCVCEHIDLAIGRPGTITWYCPILGFDL